MCIHHTAFLYAQWSVTVIAKELPSVLKLEGRQNEKEQHTGINLRLTRAGKGRGERVRRGLWCADLPPGRRRLPHPIPPTARSVGCRQVSLESSAGLALRAQKPPLQSSHPSREAATSTDGSLHPYCLEVAALKGHPSSILLLEGTVAV